MDTTLFLWLSIIIIFVLGSLAHFLYDLSNDNKILGLFTAVNESTWEHIKIAITPTLIWSLIDGFFFGNHPNYFPAKLASLLILAFFIPFVFYSYTRISKKPILAIDILAFLSAIILAELAFFTIINSLPVSYLLSYISTIGTFIFFGAYMTLTLMPLKQIIFKDPITGKYGFPAHRHLFQPHKHSHHKNKPKK